MTFKISSNLSENQIESDVASFLGYVTPFWSKRFRLISVDEQATGADKLFDRFVPIYLQFKVAEGLKTVSPYELPKLSSPLQRVRRFRYDNNLVGNPILYFKLREKAKTATDYQHNVLLSLHKPPKQYAFYIAPLTLDINEYNELLKIPLFERLVIIDPFRFHPSEIYRGAVKQSFGVVPFLRAHVSIPPTEKVTDANHHYSFSRNGADIAWHRGEKLIGDYRLGTAITRIFNLAYYNNDSTLSKDEFVQSIAGFPDFPYDVDFRNEQDPDSSIRSFAMLLNRVYRIRLFLLGVNEGNSV